MNRENALHPAYGCIEVVEKDGKCVAANPAKQKELEDSEKFFAELKTEGLAEKKARAPKKARQKTMQ